MENNCVTRTSLGGIRQLTLKQIKRNLNKNFKSLKEENSDKVEFKFYVFVSSSNKKCGCCEYFSVKDIDKACKFFMNRAELKSKRLFVAIGADYADGARDLIITGTDY